MCLRNVFLQPKGAASSRTMRGYKVCRITTGKNKGIEFSSIQKPSFRYRIGESVAAENIPVKCSHRGCEKYPHGIHCYLALGDAFYALLTTNGEFCSDQLFVLPMEFEEKDILAYGETPPGVDDNIPSLPCIVVAKAKVMETTHLDRSPLPYRGVKRLRRERTDFGIGVPAMIHREPEPEEVHLITHQ